MLRRTLKSFPTIKAIRTVRNTRFFHIAIGSFVTLDSSGEPVTKEVKLIHGDPNESYILIPPEIGYALQAGSVPSNGIFLGKDPEKHALTFFHRTRTFAHGKQPSTDFLSIVLLTQTSENPLLASLDLRSLKTYQDKPVPTRVPPPSFSPVYHMKSL